MADFERIKVTPAEDEVVIVAGAVDAGAPSGPSPQAVPAAEPGSEAAPAPAPQPDSGSAPEKPGRAPAAARGSYRETSLEDLQGTGMGAMQKAIIAAAVVAIAAFVIWYVLLR